MDIPTKKILRLLQSDQPADVRASAATVLAEVGARDGDVTQALRDLLDDPDETVRLRVIRAVGKLRIDSALPVLLERVKDGGPESHESVEAAARLGAKGIKALQGLMSHVAPGVRRTIGAALAVGDTSGGDARLDVLLDKDPAVVEAAVRSLSEQIPSLDKKQRTTLADQLIKMLGNKKTPLQPVSEAAAVRLLAGLDDPRAGPLFWDRILPPHPGEIRAAALHALGEWTTEPNKDQLKRLLTCATARDFRIAAPALLMLKKLPVETKLVPEWLTLFDAGDIAGRHLALEKLGDRDKPDVAAAMLKQVRHPDRGLREAALSRLTKLEHGREALTRALLEAETPDQAWVLARAQGPFVRDYPASWREEVFTEACMHIEAEDKKFEPLLFVLREAEPHELRDRLEEKSLAWRKKKQYAKALIYLRLLTRDPACALPIRLEQAACGLKVSDKDVSTEARANDVCLQQFVRLCQQDDAAVTEFIGSSKWLDEEDLYYLGFHLAEQEGRPKKVAGEILTAVVKKSPRSKLAQSAKSKLRSSGLE